MNENPPANVYDIATGDVLRDRESRSGQKHAVPLEPLRLGTRRSPDDPARYEGVIRDGSRIVATCGHGHRNRDSSTQSGGISARDCITSLGRSCRNPGYAEQVAREIRRSMNTYIRACATSASDTERHRANAARAAEDFLAGLPEVEARIGVRPVLGYKDYVAVPPPVPENILCVHCRSVITPERYTVDRGWAGWHTAEQSRRDEHCPARKFGLHVPGPEMS